MIAIGVYYSRHKNSLSYTYIIIIRKKLYLCLCFGRIKNSNLYNGKNKLNVIKNEITTLIIYIYFFILNIISDNKIVNK